MHDGPTGRAFGAQEPYVEKRGDGRRAAASAGHRARRPARRADRLTLPSAARAEECLAELAELAEVLGHELVVAERDTDLYLRARAPDRLTLAAEMQWQLLPGRSAARPEYALGAQLEPAYAIFGDNFDWSADADRLTLYITNGMGEGIEASLLTNLGINALRNARRAGLAHRRPGGPGRPGRLRPVPRGPASVGAPARPRPGHRTPGGRRRRLPPDAAAARPDRRHGRPGRPAAAGHVRGDGLHRTGVRRSNLATGSSSSATGCTPSPRPAGRSTGNGRWPARSTPRVCCPPPMSPARCCRELSGHRGTPVAGRRRARGLPRLVRPR